MTDNIGLIYIGDGSAWIQNNDLVPTRNLTKAEVKQFGKRQLLNSGLYVEPQNKPEVDNGDE